MQVSDYRRDGKAENESVDEYAIQRADVQTVRKFDIDWQ